MEFLNHELLQYIEGKTKSKQQIDFKNILLESGESSTNTQLINWCRFAELHLSSDNRSQALQTLDDALAHVTYLVDDRLTIADLYVWAHLKGEISIESVSTPIHVKRYVMHLDKLPLLKSISSKFPANSSGPATKPGTSASDLSFEEGGKFTDLPGAEMGKVCVRFPPEASGFMHIGHAKAALLNQHYRDLFNGRLILRFDDTNPEKEKEDYEQAILTDLPSIGFRHDHFSHTSDHFDLMMAECKRMIEMGKGYTDDTEPEKMKEERENRFDSKCRNQTVAENLRRWNEMVKGSPEGLKCCVRAKIDMKSDNGTLRDPTLYRCKMEPHVRTGTKYKVYPTYDFACPIVDSIEGVTHSLRTSEYNDRNDQFYWICDALNLRRPIVIDYSRMALQNTVLSKRKLTWFVEQKIVTGWDDPRMPTVRGVLRRGMTSEGLRQFILAQGSSRSIAYMEWDKIWAFNKKVIEAKSKRYIALNLGPQMHSTDNTPNGLVKVTVLDQKAVERRMIPNHPKDSSLGEREMWLASSVFVEQADADQFQEGTNVTFINWGNLLITKVVKSGRNVSSVEAKLNLADTDYKKTLKVTFLADSSCGKEAAMKLCPVAALTYENLINKGILGKDDDFKQFVNLNSKHEQSMLGDPLLFHLKKGDIVQLMRKGFFICDQPYQAKCAATGVESALVLISIPDGSATTLAGGQGDASLKQAVSTSSKKQTVDLSAMDDEARSKAEAKAREKEEKKAARKAGKVAATAAKTTIETPVTKPTTEAMAKKNDKPTTQATKKINTAEPSDAGKGGKKQTKLGLEATKFQDTSEWYQQIITKAEMLEYYDVSGCYILRPWAYHVWTSIQNYIDCVIDKLGVENCYFPMFVSRAALEKEKQHIEDFAPEVAWVTRYGDSEMAEPVAIRPTSETIMYPAFAKWVQSHRDLPIKLNQWSNVVRWEFKQPSPFLRTREFLWQEGHTAYASKADAEVEVLQILDMYASVYENLLALPVIKGRKTEKEKFPGGDYTTTVEAFISASGRAIQGATSHHLGQNFSKMFEVQFEDPETQQKQLAYQNSWGMTTRTLGVMVMVHADDKGLIMPPRVCRYQVVVVPCGLTAKTSEQDKNNLLQKCRQVTESLNATECSPESLKYCPVRRTLRVYLDDRDNVSPGWKFNHWELKGVPVRIEIGPKDLEKSQVTAVLRFNGEKLTISLAQLTNNMPALLDRIHDSMFEKAREELNTSVKAADSVTDLIKALDSRCLAVMPFCGVPSCEDAIKDNSAKGAFQEPGKPIMGAKSLCQPFKGQFVNSSLKTGDCAGDVKCGQCGKQAKTFTMFGRSY